MDYADLRDEGFRHLQEMADATWTDFNAHDPGITILEQVAYALSDLVYRIGYDVPDLLVSGGSDPQASLYPPEEILPGHPVTSTDLRKLVIDVPGVRNAWIEPATDDSLELHYHRPRRELGLHAEPPISEPVTPVGLFRVLIEAVDPGLDARAGVKTRVARRLYAHRPLCEDFVEISVLEPEPIHVDAAVEIGPVDDPETVLLDILDSISDQLSPPIPFTDLEQADRDGVPIDEIFAGPRLRHGYLPDDSLRQVNRPTALRTSDIVQAVMGVAGVRAITRITLAAGGGEPHPWTVDLPPRRTPRLDLDGSCIVLTRGGLTAGSGIDGVVGEYRRRRSLVDAGGLTTDGGATIFRSPPGRARSVGDYYSFQHHFPASYGIAEMGLPRTADPERQAQAKQLKAYLLLFDQLIANMFAQVAHVGDLFSFRPDSEGTYFTSVIDDESLALDAVRLADGHAERIAELASAGEQAGDPSADRRDRFLNHLLSRFAEQFSESALVSRRAGAGVDGSGERPLVRDKEAFLQQYPRVSGARGAAPDDLLHPGPDNESGLATRVRLKLGLDSDLGENFVLVEHILLRPMAGDEEQAVPLLTESDLRDPYSLRVSFVFAEAPGRMGTDDFQQLVRHTVRSETPAHLVSHVHWLAPSEFAEFRAAHDRWRQTYRRSLATRLGLDLGGED